MISSSLLEDPSAGFALLGALCLFLASLGWGDLLGRKLTSQLLDRSPSLAESLGIGSVVLAWGILALGFLGVGLGPEWRYVSRGVLGAGAVLGVRNLSRSWRQGWKAPRLDLWTGLLAGATVLLLFLRVLQGFRLSPHGDPYIYELLSPRFAYDTGKVWVPTHLPYLAQAGAWTGLYLWGFQWLGATGSGGLITGQQFAQWVHVMLGLGITALATAQLLARLGTPRWIQWVGVFGVFITPELADFSSLAKSDWGVVAWFWIALIWLLEAWGTSTSRAQRTGLLVLAGAFLGLSFTTKYSAAYSEVLLFGLGAWFFGPKGFISLIAGFALGSAPILLRNLIWTGNPVFPALHTLFESPLMGPTLREAHAGLYRDQGHWWGVGGRIDWMGRALFQHPLAWLGALSFLLLLWSRRRALFSLRQEAIAFGLPWAGIFFFLAHLGTTGIARWMGPALTLLPLTGAYLLSQALESLPLLKLGRVRTVIIATVTLGLLLKSHLPLFAFPQFFSEKYAQGEKGLLAHPTGPMKAWLREKTPESASLLLVADNEPYFLLPRIVRVSDEDPAVDSILRAARGTEDVLRAIRDLGIQYVAVFRERAKDQAIRRALDSLVTAGHLRRELGPNGGALYILQ